MKNAANCQKYHESFISDLKALSPDIIVFSEAWFETTLPYISDTVSQVRKSTGADVLLLGRNPFFGPHPNIIFKNLDNPVEINEVAWSRSGYVNTEKIDIRLAKVASETGSYFVSKQDVICPLEKCIMLIDGQMGYVDTAHWSIVGMKYYGARLLETPEFQYLLSKK
tara:strand:- start:156 stop:656 length:501 start_codon:yes stop_codon:yes gene_type:complete